MHGMHVTHGMSHDVSRQSLPVAPPTVLACGDEVQRSLYLGEQGQRRVLLLKLFVQCLQLAVCCLQTTLLLHRNATIVLYVYIQTLQVGVSWYHVMWIIDVYSTCLNWQSWS